MPATSAAFWPAGSRRVSLRAMMKAHRPRSPWKRSLSPFASLHHLT